MSVFVEIWNVQNTNKTQKMNLYTSERWLLVLAIKQKKVLKNIRPHWFFLIFIKISILSLKFEIKIFGLSNHYFWIPCPKIHIGMYFHDYNIIRTNIIKENMLMLESKKEKLPTLKIEFLLNRLEFRGKILGFFQD